MSILEFVFILLLVGISSYMSASEIALFSLSRIQLKNLKERFKGTYRKIKLLLSDPSGLLMTILIVNEIVNILLSTTIAAIIHRDWNNPQGTSFIRLTAERFFPNTPSWIIQLFVGILLTTPVLLLFCEITPKVIAARANQIIAPLTAGGLLRTYKAFSGLRFILRKAMYFVSKLFPKLHQSISIGNTPNAIKEDEFLTLIEEAQKEGTIQQTEVELIRNIFDLDNTQVREVFTPISEVFSLPENCTIINALEQIRSRAYSSRIPVYKINEPDHIIGVVYSKEILLTSLQEENISLPISEVMRKPMNVSYTAYLNSVFRRMKKQRTHLAVVLNNAGKSVGIITMTDVLGAIFEDLVTHDDPAPAIKLPRGNMKNV